MLKCSLVRAPARPCATPRRCPGQVIGRPAAPGWLSCHAAVSRRSSSGLLSCKSNADDILRQINAKYLQPADSSGSGSGSGPIASRTAKNLAGWGVFWLLLINTVIFLCDKVAHVPGLHNLYLNHAHPQWWQFITCAFCHSSWQHLSGNLFNLLIFGKLIEETEGVFGVWLTYLVTGLGGSVALYLTTPAIKSGMVTVSMGASGAVFGMFAVAVLMRLRLQLKSLLEAAILGQFVVGQVLSEVRAQVAGGLTVAGANVAHMAHLGGALVGVFLVLLLTKIPE